MQKVKVVINQTVRRYNVSHKGIKFSSATNVVGIGKSAYDIYKETTTDNPILSESDWIKSLYGTDGSIVTLGANGNWFIDGVDTGAIATTGNTIPVKPYFNVPMKCPIPYVGLESEIEDGWCLCDGRNVEGYGLVPDMRGRFIVGADPRTPGTPTDTSTNLKNYGTAGNTGGKDSVQLVTAEIPSSVVSLPGQRGGDNNDNNNTTRFAGGDKSVSETGFNFTINVTLPGGGQSHENRPPYYVVAFIIRTTYQNANGGKSAYDIAILNGFIGTEVEWLDSLNGKSAYQIALDYGFVGTIEEWILSLKGISGNDGRGIVSIVRTSGNGAAGTTDTYTITYSNSTTSTYQVVNGANGAPGTNGRGITSITRTSGNGAAGTTDTYTILFTDNSTTTFNVVNGSKGDKGDTGKGIVSIIKTSTVGLVDTYTITYTDESTSTYDVINGENGNGNPTSLQLTTASLGAILIN